MTLEEIFNLSIFEPVGEVVEVGWLKEPTTAYRIEDIGSSFYIDTVTLVGGITVCYPAVENMSHGTLKDAQSRVAELQEALKGV